MSDKTENARPHGHVTPNADGYRTRCGGPKICKVCMQELAALKQPSAGVDERPIASCQRGQFETWAMETEHPVFGYIGSEWLDHGDAPDTYANDYIQGAWVMFQARARLNASRDVPAMSDEAFSTLRGMVDYCLNARVCLGMDEGFSSFEPAIEHDFVKELRAFAESDLAPSPAPAHSKNAEPVPAGWLRFDDDQLAIFTRSKRGKDAQPLYPHPTSYRVQKIASDVVPVPRELLVTLTHDSGPKLIAARRDSLALLNGGRS
jgi:hypothetical protein